MTYANAGLCELCHKPIDLSEFDEEARSHIQLQVCVECATGYSFEEIYKDARKCHVCGEDMATTMVADTAYCDMHVPEGHSILSYIVALARAEGMTEGDDVSPDLSKFDQTYYIPDKFVMCVETLLKLGKVQQAIERIDECARKKYCFAKDGYLVSNWELFFMGTLRSTLKSLIKRRSFPDARILLAFFTSEDARNIRIHLADEDILRMKASVLQYFGKYEEALGIYQNLICRVVDSVGWEENEAFHADPDPYDKRLEALTQGLYDCGRREQRFKIQKDLEGAQLIIDVKTPEEDLRVLAGASVPDLHHELRRLGEIQRKIPECDERLRSYVSSAINTFRNGDHFAHACYMAVEYVLPHKLSKATGKGVEEIAEEIKTEIKRRTGRLREPGLSDWIYKCENCLGDRFKKTVKSSVYYLKDMAGDRRHDRPVRLGRPRGTKMSMLALLIDVLEWYLGDP